jgi:hypothetical protein
MSARIIVLLPDYFRVATSGGIASVRVFFCSPNRYTVTKFVVAAIDAVTQICSKQAALATMTQREFGTHESCVQSFSDTDA